MDEHLDQISSFVQVVLDALTQLSLAAYHLHLKDPLTSVCLLTVSLLTTPDAEQSGFFGQERVRA